MRIIATEYAPLFDSRQLPATPTTWQEALEQWKGSGFLNEERYSVCETLIQWERNHATSPSATLVISEKNVSSFPDIFCYEPFSRLTNLSLKKLGLTTLPPSLFSLKNLTFLGLRNNQLTALEGLEELTALENLDVQYNQLREVPFGISFLEKLAHLDLSYNPISRWDALGWCHHLETLCLNGITFSNNKMPQELLRQETLKELGIKGCRLQSIEGIASLKNLEIFCLDMNALKELPEEMGQLLSLRELSASSNRLTRLPMFLGKCQALDYVDVEFNAIEECPEELLREWSELSDLYLTGNRLTRFSFKQDTFPCLERLGLASNALTQVEGSLGWLSPQLDYVYLEKNKLQKLPEGIVDVKEHVVIDLEKNPLTITSWMEYCQICEEKHGEGELRLDAKQDKIMKKVDTIIWDLHDIYQKLNRKKPFFKELFQEMTLDKLLAMRSFIDKITTFTEYLGRTYEDEGESICFDELYNIVIRSLEHAEKNKEFREVFWGYLANIAVSCEDGAVFYLFELDMARQRALLDVKKTDQVLRLFKRGFWAMVVIKKRAEEYIEKVKNEIRYDDNRSEEEKEDALQAVDDIEIYLDLFLMMKEEVDFPLPNVLYASEWENALDTDREEMRSKILSEINDKSKFYDYLVKEDIWRKTLAARYPQEMQRLQSIYENDEGDNSDLDHLARLKALTDRCVQAMDKHPIGASLDIANILPSRLRSRSLC
ncbi:MAG: hypothetical protein FJZ63_02845 [Chlamydiae bacterium]|nr:hypothetical protein [Chlamydiota bacterium]